MLQKLKQRRSEGGFTLVELLIVIVVIAILAAIVINTFSGVQARARDTERQTDVKAVASQLEVYYTDNGYYPTPTQMAGTPLTLFQGLSEDAITDPQGNDSNSFQTSAATAVGQYGYVNTDADCDNTPSNRCEDFTITWWNEVSNTSTSVSSLNN